ncbi:glutathione S-transferase family protein [bacterium]|nr:MAG: glutathione S-transferase family protein [bacterium]
MDRLTLYIGNRSYSSWSLRPWMALKHAGLAFDDVVIPLDQPDTRESILRHSPSGRVPALAHGALRLWDSLAICEYVNELAPAARLWPEDPATRAVARAVSAEMHSGFAAMREKLPMNVRRAPSKLALDAATQADVFRVGAIFADCRERHASSGPYLFGAFTIADAMFAPVVTRLHTYGVDAGASARAYVDTMLAHPALAEWIRLARDEPYTVEAYEKLVPRVVP